MPKDQNEGLERKKGRSVSFLKGLLIFGPWLGIIVAIVLCVILIGQLKEALERENDNEEALKGVILQQGDLSEEVFSISEQLNEIETRLDEVISDNQELWEAETELHPELESGRDLDEWPRKVYLTFDDGPSPNTSEILDILAEYDVKATFFTVGKEAEAYGELYKRILHEGHTLGMHSYSHVYKEIYASRESFEEDFEKISSYIEEITGYKPVFYRFPGGSNNSLIGSHFEEFKEVLSEHDVKYFDWNISTGDATNPPLSAEEIVNNALNGLEEHEEVVILMHDLGNKDTTVEALPVIIEELQARNIPIVPITESTELIQYR